MQLGNYLGQIQYPKVRISFYIVASVCSGVLISNSTGVAELPLLTVIAILFGFTINAVVLLGNSSEHYLSGEKHREQLNRYYEKSLHIAIHTLGVGLLLIIVVALFQLFPNVSIPLLEYDLLGRTLKIELISLSVFSLTAYYLIVVTLVVGSTAELVKIRV